MPFYLWTNFVSGSLTVFVVNFERAELARDTEKLLWEAPGRNATVKGTCKLVQVRESLGYRSSDYMI